MCKDDPGWLDTQYGEDSNSSCADMIPHLCSLEAKRYCPEACGVCYSGIFFA